MRYTSSGLFISEKSVTGIIKTSGLPSAARQTQPCMICAAALSGLSVESVCGTGRSLLSDIS